MIKNYGEYRKMKSKDICELVEESCPISHWWDYVTALRSDDDGSLSLKRLFTCFLRGRNDFALDIRDFEGYILEDARIGQTCVGSSHWQYHTIQALEILCDILSGDANVICNILTVWLDNGTINLDLNRVQEIIQKYRQT